ncbi:MAG TPA: hypothetical protein DCP95_07105, partial [Microbacterium ginsengisoli]|nr:hypothetical protein [Microbacterium ginsengisoli]
MSATKRMTVSQALIEFLAHQWTVDGDIRERTIPGVFGIFGHGSSLSEVRMEILSPAIRFLFAWVGCSLLLRRNFSWWTLFVLAVPMIPTVLSVTRSLAFP